MAIAFYVICIVAHMRSYFEKGFSVAFSSLKNSAVFAFVINLLNNLLLITFFLHFFFRFWGFKRLWFAFLFYSPANFLNIIFLNFFNSLLKGQLNKKKKSHVKVFLLRKKKSQFGEGKSIFVKNFPSNFSTTFFSIQAQL